VVALIKTSPTGKDLIQAALAANENGTGNELIKVAETSAGKPVFRLSWKAKKGFFKSLGYKPHPGQKAYHKSLDRTRLLCGGARFGKSMAGGYDVAGELLIPGKRGWIVGDTYNDSEKEFRYIHDALLENPDKAIRDFVKENVRSIGRNAKQGQLWVRFKAPLNSFVEGRSADRPNTLLGEELDFCIFAEGSQLEKFILDKYIRQRLASRVGHLDIPTTPAGLDDLLHPLFEKGQDKANHYGNTDYFDSIRSWQFSSDVNPHYPKEEIESAKRRVREGSLGS